jgi:hypothetical protein
VLEILWAWRWCLPFVKSAQLLLGGSDSLFAVQAGGVEDRVTEQQGRNQAVHHFLHHACFEDLLCAGITWEVGGLIFSQV